MARRKSKSRSTKSKKSVALSPGISREVFALIMLGLSILLILAFFHAGGSLTEWVLDGLKLIIGNAAYVLAPLLLFASVRMFWPAKDDDDQAGLRFSNYIGFILLIFSVAGLFHIGIEPQQALERARDGAGGGLVGYLLNSILLALLNVLTASVVLVIGTLIGLVLSLNIKISDILRALGSRLSKDDEDDLAHQLGEKGEKSRAPTIHATVPLGTDDGEDQTAPAEPTALINSGDPDWKLPPLDLLEDATGKADVGNPEANAENIKKTLQNFGIEVSMQEVNIGPTVTQYTLKPESNVKLSKITELSNNLELALAAHPIRIEAPIPGKSAVGIEVPNRKAAIVRLKEVFSSEEWANHKNPLSIALGRDISGKVVMADVTNMPHLLIAGATGAGKSIMINSLLTSLLYRNSPSDLRLILVDPKRVELTHYSDIPHLLAPVIVDPDKCISALKWSLEEMERRLRVFADLGKRNIAEYNSSKNNEHMPFIVLVIDELADLMMMAPRDVEALIVRIAQKARATGIHLVVATQRPSVNVITGTIKANVPARIAFSIPSQIDSRTIIDQAGAEKLLGKGDMLYRGSDMNKVIRVQGAWVSEKEIKNVTNFLREARAPEYDDAVLAQQVTLGGGKVIGNVDMGDDNLMEEATQLVVDAQQASASYLQRRLRIGYARAARLLDVLESQGIVGPASGSRQRDVLISSVDDIGGTGDREDL